MGLIRSFGRAVEARLMMMALFVFLLVGCGGGGGTSAPATGAAAVVVGATVSTRTPVSGVGVELYALVSLADQNANGAVISNATVLINGTTLAYSATERLYSGLVTPDSKGMLDLKITTIAGDIITASTSAITALPILVVPNPFSASVSNTVSWNAPAGMGPSVVSPVYGMTLTDVAAPTYPRYATVSGTTATFFAGCCAVGTYTATLTANSGSRIPGASPASMYWVSTSVQANVNVIQ